MPPHRYPFTCTFCWTPSSGLPHVLGREARLACDACFRALLDLAVCWVCGEVVVRGDECVSLGWCFWHRACYGCLFCGNKGVVTAPGVAELFAEEREQGVGSGGEGEEMGRARQISEIPLCAHCAVACETDDRRSLLQRALRRIDAADAGLSRLRWRSKSARKESDMVSRNTATTQSLLGGDSSMDLVSPPPDLSPPSPVPCPPNAGGREADETIARLHYRRCRDPRFAELECLVPQHAALYVSIFDPVNAPAFRPSPAKPLPNWMRLLPCRDQRDCADTGEGGWAPRSVLDVHFPPAGEVVRPCAGGGGARSARAGTEACAVRQTSELGDGTDGDKLESRNGSKNEMGIVRPPTRLPASPSPPLLQQRSDEFKSTQVPEQPESECGSDGDGGSQGDAKRRASPPDFAYPHPYFPHENERRISPPKPYKRPSVVADEPLRRPSSTKGPVYERPDPNVKVEEDEGEDEDEDGCRAASPFTAASGEWNAEKGGRTDAAGPGGLKSETGKGKGKGKSVAWDETVEGGESDESCEEMPPETEGEVLDEGEDMREIEREQSPECPPQRCSSLQADAAWLRTRTPPAQSMEFLDRYRGDNAKGKDKGVGNGQKPRLLNPSLAVPGRRHARNIAGARACPTCGNVSNY
ncbi:hypothetical protein EKO27_g8330 [Xylaria grammica]|uniref:LIM zinc-binding domain-containing protein n=1 Tax=Xylaria grammica TaxID=363999 RepID=A0A439CX36_9PEZI|nr:hypothetical protein EKO27_g8330 [Xylaria grammica]